MKNVLCVDKVYNCNYCELNGFFCYTPFGGDYETCPCCGKFDFLNSTNSTKYDFLFEDDFENDIRYIYKYCDYCNIIFQLGCVHYNGGCTDDVYNCHFIKKWKHKVSNIEYKGMPKFDDKDDWFNNVNDIEVLEMYCPHNNNQCIKSRENNYNNCFICRN